MTCEKMISAVSRLFFFAAFVLLGLELIERISKGAGYTIVLLGRFSAGRLLEIAAILLVFVIAIQLREIRQELKKRNP
jgi:TRAP-type C4-dicarboxylate transport system permease small subunit